MEAPGGLIALGAVLLLFRLGRPRSDLARFLGEFGRGPEGYSEHPALVTGGA